MVKKKQVQNTNLRWNQYFYDPNKMGLVPVLGVKWGSVGKGKEDDSRPRSFLTNMPCLEDLKTNKNNR